MRWPVSQNTILTHITTYTGLSLQQFIRWLRLKRSAHQLIVDNDLLIIEIAITAGFGSHEAFTRAFKQACKFSSSELRVVKAGRHGSKPIFWQKVKLGM